MKDVSMKAVFVNLSYCLVPMGLAAWIAFSFGFLMPNGSYILHIISDPFGWGWNLFGTAGFEWTPFLTGLMTNLQFATLILGLVMAADFAFKLAQQTYADKAAARRGFLPILMYLTGLTLFFGWLYGG